MNLLLEILLVALVALAIARLTTQPWRGRAFSALKVWLTVRMVWLLSVWPVTLEDGTTRPIWQVVIDTAAKIDATTFWTFIALAVGVKLVGILSSMYRWQLILRGQGIEFTFRHIFGTFLIGRAIGFFLPSTVGLDAYMLFDAARLSGRTVEVTAGKFLEKVIGFSGIFLSFLVALPFGIAIFGENGPAVAMVTIPIASGVILALMILLWFPGLVQWVLENVPIPAKRRLHALLSRASRASAAYRDKKGLVVALFALSFVVHFTTAAMYFFTAIAVGAGDRAEFWPIAFGSSIQIFATVIGPTIGGIGIREAAQYALLGNLLGPGAAILSASLGFLAAEAPTVIGFLIWLVRGDDYRPAVCRVDGVQVDYDEAARAAMAIETDEERAARAHTGDADTPRLGARLRGGTAYGLGAGVLAGILVGVPETFAIAAGGFGTEAQVLWYGPLAYAVIFGALGLAGGLVLALLPMDRDEIRGWTPSLALLATAVPVGLAVTVFRLRRDVYAEQMPPMPVLLGVLAGFGTLALLLFLVGPRLFRGRLGTLARPLPALGLLGLTCAIGALATTQVQLVQTGGETPAPIPAALRDRPNLILVMVDTLRADHLSCYGGPDPTPNLCRIARDGGTLFQGFSHASWTKPATATLLTSLVPTSHQTMSKPAALNEDIDTLAEALQRHGYATGGFVSNTNLTESFGFAQGFDEYVYLGPDYLFGAEESSSKLVLYQIARRVWFMLPLGLHFGDFYQDSEVANAHAIPWLERHRAARFFLFLHYMDPHDPYFEHPYNGYGIARASNQHPKPELADEMHRLYKGEIAHLDAQFGRLITELERLGLYDDTVIALVADHGEEFHEHGGFWHGLTLYEEQIHVPLLVKWARGHRGNVPDARAHLARLIDVAPTLLHQAGAPVPPAMQGLDLAVDLGLRSDTDRIHYAEEDHEGNVLRAIRTERWKWIEANPGNPRGLPEKELFEIRADPGETRNRVDEEPAVAAEMHRHAEGQRALAQRGRVGKAQQAQVSAAECEALMALGYVQSCDSEPTATP